MVTCPQYSLLPSSIMKLLFHSAFLMFSFSCFPRKIQALEIQYHTINISDILLSDSTCVRAPKQTGLANRLELVHSNGPCAQNREEGEDLSSSSSSSKQTSNIISLADILVNDQLRAKSIQAAAQTNKPKLPVVGINGGFTVTVGFGTPVQNLTLLFDTGSDITWTQCEPCLGHCYQQKEPIFKPSASTTYSNISCNSKECSVLKKYEGVSGCYHNSTCVYGVGYGDGSYTSGFYSRDTLTVTPTDVVPDFRFGCGQENNGSFNQTDGLLGLGRGRVSFVSQTKLNYSGHFSYCLASRNSQGGYLTFGGKFDNNNNYKNKKKNKVVITPLLPSPPGFPTSTYYYIEITNISVGRNQLQINGSIFKTPGTVIDSGTEITRLPSEAYLALSTEFKNQMTNNVFKYISAPKYDEESLDTCFYITRKIIIVPTISFTFKGNATIHLDPSGILFVVNSTLACLAFIGNHNSTDLAIFGNMQQRNYEVMYDVPGKKLGFLSNPGCP